MIRMDLAKNHVLLNNLTMSDLHCSRSAKINIGGLRSFESPSNFVIFWCKINLKSKLFIWMVHFLIALNISNICPQYIFRYISLVFYISLFLASRGKTCKLFIYRFYKSIFNYKSEPFNLCAQFIFISYTWGVWCLYYPRYFG